MNFIKRLFNRKTETRPNIVVEGIGMDYLIKYKCGCWDAPESNGIEWMPCQSHESISYDDWLTKIL